VALDEWLTTHTDPASIAEALSDNDEFLDRYQVLYEERLASMTLEQHAARVAALRVVIDSIDGGYALVDSAREAGFICGFEYCRRLLTAKGEA
jgi:hypothetical protein